MNFGFKFVFILDDDDEDYISDVIFEIFFYLVLWWSLLIFLGLIMKMMNFLSLRI